MKKHPSHKRALLKKKLSKPSTNKRTHIPKTHGLAFQVRSTAAKKGWATRRAYEKIAKEKKSVKKFTKQELAIYHRVKAYKEKSVSAKKAARTRKVYQYVREFQTPQQLGAFTKEAEPIAEKILPPKPPKREKKLAPILPKEEIEVVKKYFEEEPKPSKPSPLGDEGKLFSEEMSDVLTNFARNENVDSQVAYVKLVDGSYVVEAKFGVPDNLDEFLLHLSEEIQVSPGEFKISIGFSIDPSEMVKPYGIRDGKEIIVDGKAYDFYKGNADANSNVSKSIASQFLEARNKMVPGLRNRFGIEPKMVTLRVFWGESIMESKVSRNAYRDMKWFE